MASAAKQSMPRCDRHKRRLDCFLASLVNDAAD
jgi:hypothetical protein